MNERTATMVARAKEAAPEIRSRARDLSSLGAKQAHSESPSRRMDMYAGPHVCKSGRRPFIVIQRTVRKTCL